MTWKREKLEAQLAVVSALHDFVVVSGGLAWHLMSPPHVEDKHIHDHSDVDLFVVPARSGELFARVKEMGFNRWWTKYDDKTRDFYRYGRTIDYKGKRVKVELDLFIRDVPFRELNGLKVVEPVYLLSLYKSIHSSSNCVAVKAARVLLGNGVDPVGRPELVTIPDGKKGGGKRGPVRR